MNNFNFPKAHYLREVLSGLFKFILLGLGVALLNVSLALAHGVIAKSEPAAGAAVAAAPAQVTIWFTEAVEPKFSSLEVSQLESAQRVDLSDTHVNADGSVSVTLRANLPRGAYQVGWRVFTPGDGHTTSGQFNFGVGVPVVDTQLTNASEGGVFPAAWRFLSLGGQALFMGLAVFRWAIRLEDERRFDRATFGMIQLIRVALGLGVFGALYVQWQSLEAPILDVLTTRWGTIWLLRFVVLSVALFKINSLLRGDEKSGALLTGAFLLFTFSLTSHSAAKYDLVGAVVDWLHLLATSIWAGGVWCVVIALRNGERKFLWHFSILAMAAVGVFVASGLWLGREQVGAWSGLLFTAYGRALLAKLAAVAVALGLGFLTTRAPRFQIVSVEAILALVILFGAAYLTNLPPAYAQISDNAPTRLELHQSNFILTLWPARVGTNTFQVHVRDAQGAAVTRAQVIATFQPLTRGVVSELPLNEIGDGLYAGAGANLLQEGQWQILLAVNEREFVSFDVQVAPDGSVRPQTAPPELAVQVVAWLNRYALIGGALILLMATAVWGGLAWRSLPPSPFTISLWLVPGLLLAAVIWLWLNLNY